MSKNSSEATGKLRMSVLRMARVNCIFVLWGKINMSDGQKISVDVALAQSLNNSVPELMKGIQKLSDAYHGDVEELF